MTYPIGQIVNDNQSYHAGPGTSSSRIKSLADTSLLHYWYAHERPDREPEEQSEDLILGTAVHTCVLEPDSFPAIYVKAQPFNRRTNAGRAMSAEFDAECAAKGQVALSPDNYQACLDIRDRVFSHPVVRGLFTGGRAELSFYAVDPAYSPDDVDAKGIPYGLVRCRPDYLHDNGFAVIDLKTARNANPKAFAKDVANLGYDLSAAWYLDTLRYCYGEAPANFIWVAVEKVPPYAMSVTFARPETVAAASEFNSHQFARLVHARRTGQWTDYADAVLPLDIPRWAVRTIEL